ncbi:MAG: hypothetical protein JO323_13990 [Acidobacteriia bacterium]|nr:hypothetical protein [Terriglobia bacterium]
MQFSLPFESLPGFTLLTDGLSAAFRSGTIESGRQRIAIIRIPRFRALEYPAICREVWATLNRSGRTPDRSAIGRAIDQAWLETLGARLRSLRDKKPLAVLVDIGGNGGGNDLGDWAVRAFTEKPIRSAPLLLSASSVAVPYFNEQIHILQAAAKSGNISPATQKALEQAINAFQERTRLATSRACSMTWVWTERRPWGTSDCTRLIESGYTSGHMDYAEPGSFEPPAARALYWASIADPVRGAWQGPTFVITDSGTGSAAEGYAALMRDSGIARTIGMRTWGDGCGFMAAGTPFVLPHLHLSIKIPDCVRLRRDNSDEVAGVAPDIEIAPLPGESPGARASRLLARVRKELVR